MASILENPPVLQQPFAYNGDKNTIPLDATGDQRASLQEGFPAITSTPITQGGIPPERKDFNGLGNLLSSLYFYLQNGGQFTFNQQVSDAIGGYPAGAILTYNNASTNQNYRVRSLINNNTFNFVTEPSYIDGVKWDVAYTDEKPGFGNIGDVKYTVSTVVPNGGAWCDGAEYTQAQFPDVYQMLVDGKLSSTDYSTFNNSVLTNGYCALFALDSSAQKFKVPKLLDKYVMDLADDVPVVGNGISVGLTNITGNAGLAYIPQAGLVPRNEALNQQLPCTLTGSGATDIPTYQAIGLTTDPEKSGMIADTSNLGKTVTLKAYVVLYSSAAGASEVQAAEFIQGLSGKANTDLSNVSSNIDYVVEQGEINNITWKKWKSGKLIQRGRELNVSETVVVTFAKPYIEDPIVLAYPINNIDSWPSHYIPGVNSTSFTWATNNSTKMNWIAIGQGA